MNIKKFDNIVGKMNRVNEVLLVGTILIMFFILLAQIFSRFVFFIPLPSSQDLLVFFLITSVFLGAATAVSANKHIAIEFLVNVLPPKIENKILILADAVSITFLGIVIHQSITLMEKTKGSLIGASPIPANGYYLVVAIGCFLMIINYINDLIKKIYTAQSREER